MKLIDIDGNSLPVSDHIFEMGQSIAGSMGMDLGGYILACFVEAVEAEQKSIDAAMRHDHEGLFGIWGSEDQASVTGADPEPETNGGTTKSDSAVVSRRGAVED